MGEQLLWLMLTIALLLFLTASFAMRVGAICEDAGERRRQPRLPGPEKDRQDRYFHALRARQAARLREMDTKADLGSN